MSFWKELKRRNVYKVGVAYAIVAWLLIQGASIIFPVLQMPKWTVAFVTVLLIIGFPLILLFAWAFEITPDGIKWTKEVPHHESITHLTGQKLNYIVTGLLVLAVGFILVKDFYIDRQAVKPEAVTKVLEQAPSVVNEAKTKKTIAVLPFVNLSSDPEQDYFVDGLSEEILNTLAKISDLKVIARTSSFAFKGKDKTVQEIAGVLGVDNILEGSVRKAGKVLRITAQLVSAVDGSHLWSETYDRELKDIFAVQEDIATAVVDELKITLGIGTSLKQLGGTDNVEAYEKYLIAKGLMWINNLDSLSRALKSIDAAVAKDPNFALAWALKATIHSGLSIWVPADRAVSELDAALNAAERSNELEPNLAENYYNLSWIKISRGDWIEAELAYRKALELPTETSLVYKNLMAVYYDAVGYFKKAHKFFEEILQSDPLNQTARAFYMLNFAFLGDKQRAEDEYEYGRTLFGDQWSLGDRYISDIRLGTNDVLSRDDIPYSDTIFDMAMKHLDSPEEGLAGLRRIYTNGDNLSHSECVMISMWAAYFGDTEFTLDAIEKGISINASGVFWIWDPLMREVRQLLQFKELVREKGLVDYWKQFGWPDFCHPLDNGDFECD